MDVEEGIRNWINPKIAVRDSPIHGKGWFATDRIDKGELIAIWRECYTNRAGAMEAIRQGKGIMQWDDDIFSVETDLHSEDYLINHSCDGNTWLRDAVQLEARRDIDEGEEITADYTLFESEEDAVTLWECNCGSSLCRGKVTGRDWRMKDVRERYRGHFSPLMNKRIGSFG